MVPPSMQLHPGRGPRRGLYPAGGQGVGCVQTWLLVPPESVYRPGPIPLGPGVGRGRAGRQGGEACLEPGPLPGAGAQCDGVKPALLCRVDTWVPSCSLGARKSGIRICLKRTSTVLFPMHSPPLGWQPSPTCPPPVQANPVPFSLQLKPIISDPEYLLDQHILISIKSSDSDESYGKGSRTGAAGVTPADRGL